MLNITKFSFWKQTGKTPYRLLCLTYRKIFLSNLYKHTSVWQKIVTPECFHAQFSLILNNFFPWTPNNWFMLSCTIVILFSCTGHPHESQEHRNKNKWKVAMRIIYWWQNWKAPGTFISRALEQMQCIADWLLLRHVVKITVYHLRQFISPSQTFCASSRQRLASCWPLSLLAAVGTASSLRQNGGCKTRKID